MPKYHHLYGVGVGPGDPELITLKAMRHLQQSTVIAYPAPTNGASLALDIAKEYCAPNAHYICMDIDMIPGDKAIQDLYTPYISTIRDALLYDDVSVICEGDPLFYGSFQYIMHDLLDVVPISIIPGISSINATGALLRKALGSRNESLAIIPGPNDATYIRDKIEQHNRVIIIKVGRHMPKIQRIIDNLSLQDSAYLVSYATMGDKETYQKLCDVNHPAPYFSIIYIERP